MGVLIPLVARAGVLAEAGSVLTAARAGRGALLTITGEPGIGKTRLAEEAAERGRGNSRSSGHGALRREVPRCARGRGCSGSWRAVTRRWPG